MLSTLAKATSSGFSPIVLSRSIAAVPAIRFASAPAPKTAGCKKVDDKKQVKILTPQEKAVKVAKQVFSVNGLLKACSIGGIGLASCMGAWNAKRAGMSPMGCFVLSIINGMGGGTMRDILQNKQPYWIQKPVWAWWCFATGLVGAYLWDPLKKYGINETNMWAKTVSLFSLAGCTCSGAEAALKQGGGNAYGQPIKGAVYAMLCATGGGVVMHTLLQRRAATLYPEGWQNVFPAAVGAVAYQGAHVLGLPRFAVVAAGMSTSIGLRVYLTKKFAAKQAAAAAAAAAAAKK